ncbi:NAD-dependent epimerase/dehydratase family protein [Nocardia sp. 2YAB30]|uniref:NAD-dependent epimerase/dehydratase family protein n=1 Tax=unclassified Nocardia TaxID=2637762 RepID=UPI003F9655E5
MTRSVLVTGVAGFIGSHTAAGLHAAGWMVTGVDHHPAHEGRVWESITADAPAPALLARVAGGEFAVVVHQAAISDTLAPDDERLRWCNATVPLRIARACAESGIRLVYASSGSVYGIVPQGVSSLESDADNRGRCSGPLNAYAESKLVMDRVMRRRAGAFGLDCVGLRYTNVFGPGEQSKGRMARSCGTSRSSASASTTSVLSRNSSAVHPAPSVKSFLVTGTGWIGSRTTGPPMLMCAGHSLGTRTVPLVALTLAS